MDISPRLGIKIVYYIIHVVRMHKFLRNLAFGIKTSLLLSALLRFHVEDEN